MLNFVFLSLLLMCSSCTWLEKNYPQDNIVEEIAEEVLDVETGIDIDFSPSTPEPRHQHK